MKITICNWNIPQLNKRWQLIRLETKKKDSDESENSDAIFLEKKTLFHFRSTLSGPISPKNSNEYISFEEKNSKMNSICQTLWYNSFEYKNKYAWYFFGEMVLHSDGRKIQVSFSRLLFPAIQFKKKSIVVSWYSKKKQQHINTDIHLLKYT